MENDIKDCRTKVIYHYLTETINDSDLKVLIDLLKDYVYNGSFIDFEESDVRVQPLVDDLYKILGF